MRQTKSVEQQMAQFAADITNQGWGLGRYYAPDPRDQRFPMAAQLPPLDPDAPEHVANKFNGMEQPSFSGAYPITVACAWRNWISAYPIGTYLGPTTSNIYNWCKARDGLPASVRATTIRAGAQALYDEGYIGNYHWADTTQADDAVSTIRRWLLYQKTPIVVGANIYTGFCEPIRDGTRNAWWVSTRGHIEGEAAFIIVGWSDALRPEGAARIMWASPMWGRHGICYIDRYALARLLSENGEACGVTDKRVGSRASLRKMRRQPNPDFSHIPLPLEPIVNAHPPQRPSRMHSFPPNYFATIDPSHPKYTKWFGTPPPSAPASAPASELPNPNGPPSELPSAPASQPPSPSNSSNSEELP